MYNFIIALTFFTEMLIAYSFFSQIGKRKRSVASCIFYGILIFESGTLIDLLLSNIVWINTLYFIVINLIFSVLCFKIKFSRALFYSIVLDVFSTALEFSTIFLVSTITNTDTTAYLEQLNMLVLELAISKTMYFLVCSLLARLAQKEKAKIRFPFGLYMYPIVTVASLLVFWSICANSNISYYQKIALAVISAALFVSTVVLFIIYQHNIEKQNELFQLQNEFDMLEADKTYYEILEKQNQELMIYAHDTKKHLTAIRELNENPIIDEYVSTMTDDLKAHTSSCHSGNHLLDVIINKYDTECKIKSIDFSFDVTLCSLSIVSSYDLVTILNNLLDNAIEAAVNSESKFVSLFTNHINTFDVIVVSNSCDKSPLSANGELKTTKRNKNYHGFGMKSIKKALKKYDGDLDWEYDRNSKIFTITVMILNN